jgi:hypothetical protein
VHFWKRLYNTLHVRKKRQYCPCKVYKNVVMFKDREVIHEYLVQSGFMDNYFIWTKHGETQPGTKSIIDERAKENMNIPDDV